MRSQTPSHQRLAITAILLTTLALSGCLPLKQFRTETLQEGTAGDYGDLICAEEAPNSPGDDCSFERRTYKGPPDPTTGENLTGEYLFASIEFDDQGWFWDRRQMEVLLRQLYEDKEQEYLILAFAHGWQHNANACDNNVVCWQRALERMDLSDRFLVSEYNRLVQPETPRKPRKVVGIYIGWRGRSGANKPARVLSFFSRKRAANRVGIGGVTELLTRLDDFRDYKNRLRERDERSRGSEPTDTGGEGTQLVVIGHSFGGQVVYRAVAPLLVERASSMRLNGDRYGYHTANSIGDLVILVNPAFEGAAYENLQFAATNRCYPPWQRPSLVVVTSDADSATGKAFPAGRTLSNLRTKERSDCRSEQKRAVRRTVGHYDERYTTHELVFDNPSGDMTQKLVPKSERNPDDEGCDCPYLKRTDQLDLANMRRIDSEYNEELVRVKTAELSDPGSNWEPGYEEELSSMSEFKRADYGEDGTGNRMILKRSPDYAANYPYLVVTTDADFLPSHSSIYGEHFTDFLRHFYFRHLVARVNFPEECFEPTTAECIESPVTPCERSWKGRLDYNCEDPPKSNWLTDAAGD